MSEPKTKKQVDPFFASLADLAAERLLKRQKRAEKRAAREEAEKNAAEKKPLRVILRGMMQSAEEGRLFEGDDAFWQAIDCKDFTGENPVIEWEEGGEVAILDLDFHGSCKPDRYRLQGIADTVKPAPAAWAFSRSGGLHLVYLRTPHIDARGHAAIGRMVLRDLLPDAEFEILTRMRHPKHPCEGREGGTVPAREVIRQITNPADLEKAWRSLLSEFEAESSVDPDVRDEWLSDRGLSIGVHHPGEKCPFGPHGGKNDPVRCFPDYVYCHKCKRGAPYSRLIKGDVPVLRNHLRNAVRHFAHWNHVQHFIKDRDGYRALLLLYHLQDGNAKKEAARRQLIDRVFDPDLMVLRSERVWLQTDFRPAAEKGLIDLLSSLPVLQNIDEKGKIHLSKKRRALFLGMFDLTRFGYPEIIPLHGVDLAAFARMDEPQRYFDPPIYAVIPSTPPFSYVPNAASQLAWARGHLEQNFRGVRFDLIEWLLFIKGLFQLGYVDEVIVTFITGQSEGGKTAHAKLAGVLGFEAPELIRLRKDEERFRQDFADASRIGTTVIINEAGKGGMTGSDVHQAVLMLERGMRYHHMYFGPRKILNPAAPIMTNPRMPDEIREDKQTRRRCIEFPLGAGIQKPGENRDWYISCGTGNLQNWLIRDDTGDNLKCANIICSYIQNKYFSPGSNPRPADVAKSLGINTAGHAATEAHSTLRKLFDFWLTGERFDGTSNIWVGGREAGWVVIRTNEETDVSRAFADASADGQNIERVEAECWPEITGIDGLVCEIRARPNRPRVGFRFGFRTAGGGFTPLDPAAVVS